MQYFVKSNLKTSKDDMTNNAHNTKLRSWNCYVTKEKRQNNNGKSCMKLAWKTEYNMPDASVLYWPIYPKRMQLLN